MVAQDLLPDIMGVWYRELEDVKSEHDFGIFYMYPGWCFDWVGSASIKIRELDDIKIKFNKKYDSPLNHSFEYEGTSENGVIYRGKWIGSHEEGKFVLTKTRKDKLPFLLEVEDIEKIVGHLQNRAFYYNLRAKRRSFPFSPLREALKKQ